MNRGSIINFAKESFKEFLDSLQNIKASLEIVKKYLTSPYRILLLLIVISLFGPQIFLLNEDLGILGAFEIDPRANINAISDLFKSPYFNMNNGYTSSLYGWTYFFINFWILLPFKILFSIFHITSQSAILFLIKLILLFIGTITIVLIFDIVKILSKNSFFAFLCSLYSISFHPINHWLYFIHPDSTGLLFLLLSSICFVKFSNQKTNDLNLYYIGLFCLVLSSLSKHIFLFLCLPLFISYLYLIGKKNFNTILDFAKSKLFLNLFIKSTILSLVIFFIIHPFAFLEIGKFFKIQIDQVHNNGGTIPKSESIPTWIEKIKGDIIVSINLFILTPLLLLAAFNKKINYKVPAFFYWSVFGTFFASTLLVISESMWMNMIYFYPMYPFMIINIAYVFFLIGKYKYKIISLIVLTPISLVFLGSFISNSFETYNNLYARSLYKHTTAYKSFAFVESLPRDVKITWDHFVAMPDSRNRNYDCFYWSNCGSKESVFKFSPDYLIFNENFLYNGDYSKNTKILRDYVSQNSYKKIELIKHDIPNDAFIYLPPTFYTSQYKTKLKELSPIFNNSIDKIFSISSIRNKIIILQSISYIDKHNITVGESISVYKKNEQ